MTKEQLQNLTKSSEAKMEHFFDNDKKPIHNHVKSLTSNIFHDSVIFHNLG
jgi:hypothetical protein